MGIEDYEKQDFSAYSVLIVDDVYLNTILLQKSLQRFNFKIRVATSGLQALDMVSAEKPTVILLDVMMPGTDGLKCLQILRADPSNAGIRIIMVTAVNANEDIVKALSLGANDYITKPIKLDKLYASVINQINAFKTTE